MAVRDVIDVRPAKRQRPLSVPQPSTESASSFFLPVTRTAGRVRRRNAVPQARGAKPTALVLAVHAESCETQGVGRITSMRHAILLRSAARGVRAPAQAGAAFTESLRG